MKASLRILCIVCVVGILAVLVAGCQRGDPFPTAPVPDPGASLVSGATRAEPGGLVSGILDLVPAILAARPISPDPSGSQSFSLDGAKGGTFRYGRYRLAFPAGAVAGNAVITMSVPDGNVIGCALSISPANLNSFSKPVRLSMDCRGTNVTPLNSLLLRTWWQVPTGWQMVGDTFVLSTWSEESNLRHFSNYRAGWGPKH